MGRGVGFDGESVAQQGGHQDSQQAPGGQGADIAVDLGQHAPQVVAAADTASVLPAPGNHQVVGQIVVPARAGARHAGGEDEHGVIIRGKG